MLSGRVFFSVSRLFISANLQGRLVWLFCLAFTLVWASESGVVFHAQARLRGEAVTSRWRMVPETAAPQEILPPVPVPLLRSKSRLTSRWEVGLGKVAQTVKHLPTDAGDPGLIPGSGRSFGKGNDNPLQYSYLGNSTDRSSTGGIQSMGSQRVGHDWATNTSPSVQFNRSVVSDSLRPQGLQHAKPPCPSPTPGVYSNSCPLSQWCHPTISSSVVPFSSCPQSFPESGSFQMSQLFASGGQRIGVSASASVLPVNTWDWSPLGWTGRISLQSEGPSRGEK